MIKNNKIFLIMLGIIITWLQFCNLSYGAQLRLEPNGDDLKGSYLPTSKAVYQSGAMVSTFNPDGYSNYPNEIYLPNEENPAQYRIHSNYSKNTDACAACHATHTAVGPSLLQWSSTYEACMACHDGTVSTTYDVQTGEIADTTSATYGGLFGTGKENFLSKHNAADGLEIGAAPGGTTTGVDLDGDTVSDQWTVEFGCQSCHSPHGFGGNARILNPDPNGVALANRQTKVRATSLDSVTFAVYPGATGLAEGDPNKKPYYMLKGYRYDTWLAVYDRYDNQDRLIPADKYDIDNNLGYSRIIFDPSLNNLTPPVAASFVYAIRVDMTIGNYLEINETVDYRSGTVAFCEACHSDYSQPSGTGIYAEAYRHAVNVDVSDALTKKNLKFEYNKASGQYDMLVCLTCHVAHGTDQDYWLKTLPGENYDENTAYEITGSSALKRKPNTGVCVTCHQENSGELIANQSPSPAGFSLIGGGFVGSAQCQSCHKKHYTGWQDTLHSKMVRTNVSIDVYAKDNATTWKGSQDLRRNDNNDSVSPNNVALVLGSKWKQTYLVGDSTNGYKFLSYQWNIPERTWESFGLKADWDKYCIACHSTGYKVISKDVNETVTGWTKAEFGIGCEACHGEGGNHKANPSGDNIWNPAEANMTVQTRACGYCHMGGNSSEFKALIDTGPDQYEWRPDIPYPVGQTYKPWVDWQVYGVVPGVNANFADYDENDTNKWFYNSVNGIFDERQNHQQYQGFLQSKHMTSGVITCSTCHSSHGRNSSKEQLKQTSAQICAACHGSAMAIDTYMPETGKTIQNVYVRSHTFRKPHRDVPSGAVTGITNP